MKKLSFHFLFLASLTLKAIDNPYVKPLPKIIDGKTIPNVKPFMGDYLYMAETEVTK